MEGGILSDEDKPSAADVFGLSSLRHAVKEAANRAITTSFPLHLPS